jgi:hypothetical protein
MWLRFPGYDRLEFHWQARIQRVNNASTRRTWTKHNILELTAGLRVTLKLWMRPSLDKPTSMDVLAHCHNPSPSLYSDDPT